MKRLPVLLLLTLIAGSLEAQSYKFFNYSLAEGLCDNFAYTINQDPEGFLWIGTTRGLCRFDGNEFEQDFQGDSIPVSIAFTSLLDSRGRLWFGHDNGLISFVEKGSFTLVEPRDDFRSTVRSIQEDRNGNIMVLFQQSGILRISPGLEITYLNDPADPTGPFAGKFLNDFQVIDEEILLVGTNEGLSLYRFDEDLESYIHTGDIEDLKYLVVQEIVPAVRAGEYWVGTEDEGLYRVTGEGMDPEAYAVDQIGEEQGLAYSRITSIVFDGDHRVWISDYMKGIHRCELDGSGNLGNSILFDVEKGIPNAYINHIFIDEEGNQWFSSQGNGIAVLRDQAFTFYDIWAEDAPSEVSAILLDDDRYWFGSRQKLASFPGGEPGNITYYGKDNGLPEDRITALYADDRQNLYIGTENSGLYLMAGTSDRISPLVLSRNSLENAINAIDGNSDSIFVATNNGVYSYNLLTGRRNSFTTVTGLPYNKINDILVDSQGRAWVATSTSGIVTVDMEHQLLLEGRPKLEFVSLVEDGDGVIWAGTYGDGIYQFHDDTLSWYSSESGLESDYTYSMGIDPRGYIWVGHRMGFSRIDPARGLIRRFDRESGFTSDNARNAMATSAGGQMFIGTTGEIIRYDAFQAREDTIPPRLSLKSVVISDVPYDPTKPIRLKYDKYRVRIDFIGINLSNPDQVRYQFKLDGLEEEWSDVTGESYAYYGSVEDGNYTFMLRACDADGNCSEQPLTLDITVKIPIWKSWWFIVSLVVAVIASIFVIFKIRERNQKAIQEYLQRQLDERTREVIQQKEEIEIKNRDITDSINYAQRIQASILPPIKKLHDTFSGSFVFYQPRDIVSGDFYWYEKLDESRFVIVCADSTGHGVPGAFMSMIGTTLIKDICLRSGTRRPSEILVTLDREVRESLNQNMESNGSNDGMDIIVAEVDLKNYRFVVSSAMRPLIIYSRGEQVYVKGSRSSVGGQLDEGRLEKDFIDQEFQLHKGDIIYMFSDGYPDQFGGPLGRKYKMVRLKNLLRDIHDKPMEEQYNYIKSNFFLWKEDMDQVDDVLFMGIKL